MANTVNVELKSYVLETEVKVSARGKSAYESWLSQGNTGTEADFVNAMLQDATFIFEQQQASNEWTIVHNLNKFPAVTVVDSANNVVVGDIQYLNANSLRVTFTAVFSGQVYLN